VSNGAVELVDVDAMLGRHPALDAGRGTVAEFLTELDRVGVSEAIVGHTVSWLHQPTAGNRRVVELTADQPRLRPVWVMLPDTTDELPAPAEFVRLARAEGVAAVRAYPGDHGYDLAGADAAATLAALAEARLPLLVDFPQTSWAAVEAVAHRLPELSIVVCHCSYRTLRQIAGVLSRTDNVHLCLSNLASHCGLEWLVERFGAGRLLFGTGAPEEDPAEAVTRLLWSELDDDAVAAIGSGNARRLFSAEVAAR
jgi:predicted TIM-barrel fold metal-dependent hydrolase